MRNRNLLHSRGVGQLALGLALAALSVLALWPAMAGADKKVKLWKLSDGSLIKSIDNAHAAVVTTLFFTLDNKKLITGGADKKVKVWNLESGDAIATIDAHDGAVLGVFATPEITVTGGTDSKVKLWDGQGNIQFEINTEHDGGLTCMAVGQTQVLYTGGGDGKLKFWSFEGSGEFEGTQGSVIKAMAVTDGGKALLVGGADGKVKVWDAVGHKLKAEVGEAHRGGVTAIAATPDGKLILTGGADKKVKAWSADGKLLKEVEAHEEAVTVILYVEEKQPEKKENSENKEAKKE